MNNVASAERKHIVLIGKRNAGKSSLMNALTGSNLVIVSDIPGTTTDPVRKSIELLPFGPVVLVDTAGIDDNSELGNERINKTKRELNAADLVLLVTENNSSSQELVEYEKYLNKTGIPFIRVCNKSDLHPEADFPEGIKVSAATGFGIDLLKELIARTLPGEITRPLVADLVRQNDVVILVTPIDLGAPKGRLIMPQVQTIRESLDSDAITIIVKDKELRSALAALRDKPALIVTDSQAIMRVVADVPQGVPVTTFSILMARYKGELLPFLNAVRVVETLQNGDRVLIAESCTHHAQEDDIGKVKIPRWLRNYTRKDITIDSINGPHLPDDIDRYKLIVHCGGCMITRNAMLSKVREAKALGIPITNYGLLISYLHGALPQAITPFPEAMAVWNENEPVLL